MRETEAILPPDEKNNPCMDTVLPPEFIDPPFLVVEQHSESRLIQPLRAAAQQIPSAVFTA